MADGYHRFQGGTGQFYYSQQAHHPRHIQQRNGSPVNSGRTGFSTDTPSPSRSPGPQSPAHNTYGMYNQGHHQGQHGMMNGSSHQRFNMNMNLHAKQYQNQGGHHQNHQHHQHQEHNGPGGHGINYANHQHNISSGALSTAQPHFTPSHMQNGTPSSQHSGLDKPRGKYHKAQEDFAQESREMTMIHSHARNQPNVNKNVLAGATNGTSKEPEKEERYRVAADGSDSTRSKQAWTGLDMSGTRLRAISRPLFDYNFLTRLFLNNNKLPELSSAIGQLRNLEELDVSCNELTELPPEVGMLSKLKIFGLVDNHLQSLPSELGALYKLDMLALEGNNDLPKDFMDILYESGTPELIKVLREQAPAPPPPNERDWIVVESPDQNVEDKVTVMSYNILCEKACTQAQFGYSPSNALAWENRRELILDELRGRDADIICLQETDTNFFEFLRPALAMQDYKGVYWPRSRARTMVDRDAKMVDGCATFFKDSKYDLLDKQLIDFNNIAINRPDMKGEHDIFNRVMPRDNIAVLSFLENKHTGSRIIAANTHVFWDPNYSDVKVIQVAIMMEQITKMVDKYAKWPAMTSAQKQRFKYRDEKDEDEDAEPIQYADSMSYSEGAQIPLILCGDFNSTPDSGVYDLIVRGALDSDHVDLGNRKYGNFTKDGMGHQFSLKSSYSHIGELRFTNYTPGFEGVLDYVFYSTNSLSVTGLLGNVDQEYLQRVPGFPNYHFPSDHLPMVVEFAVKPKKEKPVITETDFGTQSRRA